MGSGWLTLDLGNGKWTYDENGRSDVCRALGGQKKAALLFNVLLWAGAFGLTSKGKTFII
jgi:hypothetical protein